MADKRFGLGILTMVLAFGMAVIGCDSGTGPSGTGTGANGDGSGVGGGGTSGSTLIFRNDSSYIVNARMVFMNSPDITDTGWTPSEFSLSPSQSQTVRHNINNQHWMLRLTSDGNVNIRSVGGTWVIFDM